MASPGPTGGHNHQTDAIIGVYEGVGNNHLYQVRDERLVPRATRCLRAGDVISLGPHAIHSVETAGDDASRGIHVYLGPLTTTARSLFDWESGAPSAFTDEDYDEMKRPSTARAGAQERLARRLPRPALASRRGALTACP